MKTFKAICAATVIALSLSVTAYADPPPPGDIHIPGLPAPADGGIKTPTATEDTGLADGSSLVAGDTTFSALADILSTLASIF